MKAKCDECGKLFEPEPGFYQGAMFVSYALSVLLVLGLGVFLYLLFEPSPWTYVIVVSIFILLFAPLNFRISRSLYLAWFGSTYH